MHAFFSFLSQATPLVVALAAVAALFAVFRPVAVAATPEGDVPTAKPAPAESLAVAHGGDAKGHNLDLFGGWPEGYVRPKSELHEQPHLMIVDVTSGHGQDSQDRGARSYLTSATTDEAPWGCLAAIAAGSRPGYARPAPGSSDGILRFIDALFSG